MRINYSEEDKVISCYEGGVATTWYGATASEPLDGRILAVN